LQEVLLGYLASRSLLGGAEHREDRPDYAIDVNVAGAVKRVIDQKVLSPGITVRNDMDGRHLFRGQCRKMPAPLIGFEEDID
jgi:hypothetical protein